MGQKVRFVQPFTPPVVPPPCIECALCVPVIGSDHVGCPTATCDTPDHYAISDAAVTATGCIQVAGGGSATVVAYVPVGLARLRQRADNPCVWQAPGGAITYILWLNTTCFGIPAGTLTGTTRIQTAGVDFATWQSSIDSPGAITWVISRGPRPTTSCLIVGTQIPDSTATPVGLNFIATPLACQ